MLIYVKYAPNHVIAKEFVSLPPCVAVSGSFPCRRSLDQGLGDASLVVDLDLDQRIAEQ
jgi:hypothetical protein